MIEQGFVHDAHVRTFGSQMLTVANIGDTSLFVQDAFDFIETGGSLRITSSDGVDDVVTPYDYLLADPELDVITLAAPLTMIADVGDRVEVWPTAQEKIAEVVLVDTEESITAQVAHALVDLIPEGIRDEDDQEFVTVELQEGGQWTVTNAVDKPPAIQSTNYDGDTGWMMDAESIQFENVNVVGEAGAESMSANSFLLGGQDLATEVLGPNGKGVIAQATWPGTGTVDTASVSANTMMMVFSCTGLQMNRVYKISYGIPLVGTVTADLFYVRVYSTTDGTTPAVTGIIQNGSICPIQTLINQTILGEHTYFYYPTADVDTFKMGFALVRQAGTGTAKINLTNTNLTFYVAIEDVGDAATVVGSLSQKSKATGTADVDPVATYTRRYWATDSQAYDGNDGKRDGDANTTSAYQGRYSSTHGRTKSTVHFNDAQIRSDLAGASISKVTLTYRVQHSYYNSGLNVRVKAHNYSTPPSGYGYLGSEIAARGSSVEGSTYTLTLPNTFGTELKNGTQRGISFGAPNDALIYYGYMYGGGTSTSRPRLNITYTK